MNNARSKVTKKNPGFFLWKRIIYHVRLQYRCSDNFWTIWKHRLSHNSCYVNCFQITYQQWTGINEYLPNIWGDSRKKYMHIKHCLKWSKIRTKKIIKHTLLTILADRILYSNKTNPLKRARFKLLGYHVLTYFSKYIVRCYLSMNIHLTPSKTKLLNIKEEKLKLKNMIGGVTLLYIYKKQIGVSVKELTSYT